MSPSAIERPDGANRPTSGSPRRAGSATARAVVLRRAATPLTSPLRRIPLQLERAHELHLMLELDAESLPDAPARLGHQRETVGRRRTAGVLDEVRMPRRDQRSPDA